MMITPLLDEVQALSVYSICIGTEKLDRIWPLVELAIFRLASSWGHLLQEVFYYDTLILSYSKLFHQELMYCIFLPITVFKSSSSTFTSSQL